MTTDEDAAAVEDVDERASLTIADWLLFLIGWRGAIDAVARSKQALWLGLAFTLSAGLAREYDGVYLLRELWHLALPLVASLATSALLFGLVRAAAVRRGVTIPWGAGYRTVLTFFWMTAPLAWIYAIPVERFTDPGTAMAINLGFLAVVSSWRVYVIIAALTEWLDASAVLDSTIVAFFALTVALIGSWITPTPLWDVMGGIRLPPSAQVVMNAKLMLWVFGIPAWFILAIATLIAINAGDAQWTLQALPDDRGPRVSRPAWGLAATLLILGAGLLPLAQPEQARSWRARQLLESGEIVAGLQFMTATTRDGFPPHWSPPPDTAYADPRPDIESVIAGLDEAGAPQWLRDAYFDKLLATTFRGVRSLITAARAGNTRDLAALVEYLERTIPHKKLEWQTRDELNKAADDPEFDPALRRQIREYLALPDAPAPAEEPASD